MTVRNHLWLLVQTTFAREEPHWERQPAGVSLSATHPGDCLRMHLIAADKGDWEVEVLDRMLIMEPLGA